MTARRVEPLIPSGLPWVSTVVLFLLVVAKVVSVSYGSTTTAMALVDSAGAFSVAMGTLSSSFGSFAGVAFILLSSLGGRDIAPTEQVVVRALTVGLWVILVSFSWWGWAVTGVFGIDRVFGSPMLAWVMARFKPKDKGLTGAAALRDRLESIKKRQEAGEDVTAEVAEFESELTSEEKRVWSIVNLVDGIIFTVIGSLALVAFLWPTPWLPPERIELKDGTEFVGYVVSEEGEGEALVLKDGNRTLVAISLSEIAKSELCSTSSERGWLGASLFELFLPDTAYPPCEGEKEEELPAQPSGSNG